MNEASETTCHGCGQGINMREHASINSRYIDRCECELVPALCKGIEFLEERERNRPYTDWPGALKLLRKCEVFIDNNVPEFEESRELFEELASFIARNTAP